MQTQDFLDSYSISDAQFIGVADILGLDPSLDELSEDQQSQILDEITKAVDAKNSTQTQKSVAEDHESALAQLQNETASKLEALLDQSEAVVENVESNCIEVVEVVSDRIADAVQSIMPGVVQRTTEKLQEFTPSSEPISPLGKHENRFQNRLQKLRGSRAFPALPKSRQA